VIDEYATLYNLSIQQIDISVDRVDDPIKASN